MEGFTRNCLEKLKNGRKECVEKKNWLDNSVCVEKSVSINMAIVCIERISQWTEKKLKSTSIKHEVNQPGFNHQLLLLNRF